MGLPFEQVLDAQWTSDSKYLASGGLIPHIHLASVDCPFSAQVHWLTKTELAIGQTMVIATYIGI